MRHLTCPHEPPWWCPPLALSYLCVSLSRLFLSLSAPLSQVVCVAGTKQIQGHEDLVEARKSYKRMQSRTKLAKKSTAMMKQRSGSLDEAGSAAGSPALGAAEGSLEKKASFKLDGAEQVGLGRCPNPNPRGGCPHLSQELTMRLLRCRRMSPPGRCGGSKGQSMLL